MAVRTSVLGALTVAVGGAVTLATVPAGETWIIKSIYMTPLMAVDTTGEVWWKRSVPAITAVIAAVAMPANSGIGAWQGFAVGLPGDVLQAFSINGTVVYWVSGSKLAGVAP